MVVKLLSGGEGLTKTGILAPQPCPHTLPPLLDEAGVLAVPYRLMEDRGWALDLNQLRQALESYRGRCNPRAIYISNPGNPTGPQHTHWVMNYSLLQSLLMLLISSGHVQDRKSIQEVVQLAAAEKLLLLVDEVNKNLRLNGKLVHDRLLHPLQLILCSSGVPGQCVRTEHRVPLLQEGSV